MATLSVGSEELYGKSAELSAPGEPASSKVSSIKSPYDSLFTCADLGNIEGIRNFYRSYEHLDLRKLVNKDGDNPMHISVRNGNEIAIRAFYELSPGLMRLKNKTEQTPFDINLRLMKSLFPQEAPLNYSERLEMINWIDAEEEFLYSNSGLQKEIKGSEDKCPITFLSIYDSAELSTIDNHINRYERYALLRCLLMNSQDPITRDYVTPKMIRDIFAARKDKFLHRRSDYWKTTTKKVVKYTIGIIAFAGLAYYLESNYQISSLILKGLSLVKDSVIERLDAMANNSKSIQNCTLTTFLNGPNH